MRLSVGVGLELDIRDQLRRVAAEHDVSVSTLLREGAGRVLAALGEPVEPPERLRHLRDNHPVPKGADAMSDRERDRAIHDRANALMAEILARLETDPDSVGPVEMMLAAISGIGVMAASRPGRGVTLGPVEIAILAEGATAILTSSAAADVEQAVQLERTLASKPPAILH